jgi:hypothetical protein
MTPSPDALLIATLVRGLDGERSRGAPLPAAPKAENRRSKIAANARRPRNCQKRQRQQPQRLSGVHIIEIE